MAATRVRDIIHIDEEKCDGCGLCVPMCAEGAIQIIDGKARLVGENLCDGLGNCLGTCPRDAIRIERREAENFDEAAVAGHLARIGGQTGNHAALQPSQAHPHAHADSHAQSHATAESAPCGCPGAALCGSPSGATQSAALVPQSELAHWPVQLHLLPIAGSLWQNADVLIAADCVAFAMPDFHSRLLRGKVVAVGCPKLDDLSSYVEKLTAVFSRNQIRTITVAHMEVPCCSGIVGAVAQALRAAGAQGVDFSDVTVGIDGKIQEGTQ